MKTLEMNEIEQVAGGFNACQGILMVSFGMTGALLSMGNPGGAILGAAAGHWVGDAIGGACQG